LLKMFVLSVLREAKRVWKKSYANFSLATNIGGPISPKITSNINSSLKKA